MKHALDSFQTKPNIALVMCKMKCLMGLEEERALPLAGNRLVLPESFAPSYGYPHQATGNRIVITETMERVGQHSTHRSCGRN